MLELLIAMGVMTIGLVAVVQALTTGFGSVKASESLTAATAHAQRKMEELRASARANFGGLASGSNTQGAYTITWTVSRSGAAPTRLATVTVSVRWPGPHANSVDLVSVIAE
jgi:type II secretory pathway pseudopilin PulG